MANIAERTPIQRNIEIVDPGDGGRIGIRINLASMDDPAVEKVRNAITERRLYLDARGKTFKADEIETNRHNLLWAAVKGWEWYNPTGEPGDDGYDANAMPDFDGEQPEFNQKNFIAIISRKGMQWFGDQINEGLGDEKAFFGSSKTN